MSKRPLKKGKGRSGNQTNRRETSRVAAKMRREHENTEIYELARLLPLPSAITSQLDKASILRITISYIRMKMFFDKADRGWRNGSVVVHPLSRYTNVPPQPQPLPLPPICAPQTIHVDDPMTASTGETDGGLINQYLVQALDGFILVISCSGSVLYVSETVSSYLGLSQVDLIGRSLYDYCHLSDHAELRDNLNPCRHCRNRQQIFEIQDAEQEQKFLSAESKSPATCTVDHEESDYDRSFFILIKNVLSKKGGEKSGIKCPGFKVIQVNGKMRFQHSCPAKLRCSSENCLGLLAVCKPLDPPSMTEICLLGNCFMSRHSLDMKYIFCDSRISHLVGYNPSDMLGKVVYHFHHPNDMSTIAGCHSNLIAKGQSTSKSYRFLARDGHWMWLQTSATIAYNARTQRAQYITCLNYIVSEDQEDHPMNETTREEYSVGESRPIIDLSPGKASKQNGKDKRRHLRMPVPLPRPPPPQPPSSQPLPIKLPPGIPPISEKFLTPMPSGSGCAEVELFDNDPKLLGEAISAPYRKSSNDRKEGGEVTTYIFNDIPPQLVGSGSASDKVLLSGDKRKRNVHGIARKNGTVDRPGTGENGGKKGGENGVTQLGLDNSAENEPGDLSLVDLPLPDDMQWIDFDKVLGESDQQERDMSIGNCQEPLIGYPSEQHVHMAPQPPPLLYSQPGVKHAMPTPEYPENGYGHGQRSQFNLQNSGFIANGEFLWHNPPCDMPSLPPPQSLMGSRFT